MSYHTHEWTFNYQSVIYTVRGGIFCQVEYFQAQHVYIWSPSQSILILYPVLWNLDFVFSKDNLFWISCLSRGLTANRYRVSTAKRFIYTGSTAWRLICRGSTAKRLIYCWSTGRRLVWSRQPDIYLSIRQPEDLYIQGRQLPEDLHICRGSTAMKASWNYTIKMYKQTNIRVKTPCPYSIKMYKQTRIRVNTILARPLLSKCINRRISELILDV